MSDLDETEFKARGETIKRRRLTLGIKSQREFASAVGNIDRDTIRRAEEGAASSGTYDRLDAWLDRFEETAGTDEPSGVLAVVDDDLIEFRVSGNFGVAVVVKGPVRDLSKLEESVNRLIDRIGTTPLGGP